MPDDDRPRPRRRFGFLKLILAIGIGAFLLMQVVPYGWTKSNPAVAADAPWPSARAEQLARAACYDCHSNETDWPAYSYVAPMSWLVRYDVERGRDELNFSDWRRDSGEADDAAETIEEGSMPPRQYELLHPSARLTAQEQRILADALRRMDEED